MAGNRLVIGVDYGTTYTGVAYCETTKQKDVVKQTHVIQDWPSTHSMVGTREKVPTEISYTDGRILWGAMIPPQIPRHKWTKLELDKARDGEAEMKAIRSELSAQFGDLDAVDVAADFLSKIRQHLVKSLDTSFGAQRWNELPITLVITVPAIWSDIAKARTLQAFTKAGFDNKHFPTLDRFVTTAEPEAAAIYTAKDLSGGVNCAELRPGDGFVLCDLGGGTADLISYRVTKTNPLSIEEATIGSGCLSGGSSVDREFYKWLESVLGVDDFVTIAGCRAANVDRTKLQPKLGRIVQDFNFSAKNCFAGQPWEQYQLRLPAPLSGIDDPDRAICDGELCIKDGPLRDMFKPSLRMIEMMLRGQVREARDVAKVNLKYIFLVGGFSESPYVLSQIKLLAMNLGIEAIKPTLAWSAVVRGAVAVGIEDSNRKDTNQKDRAQAIPTVIDRRRCRRHYGSAFNAVFNKKLHNEAESYLDYNGEKFAKNQMKWMIVKGQILQTDGVAHGQLYLTARFAKGQTRLLRARLYACDGNKPPQRSTDPSIYRIGDLEVKVPDHELEKKQNGKGGRIYYETDLMVNIVLDTVLRFSVTIRGKQYGSVVVKYA